MIPIPVQCSAQALPQMAAEGRCDLALRFRVDAWDLVQG